MHDIMFDYNNNIDCCNRLSKESDLNHVISDKPYGLQYTCNMGHDKMMEIYLNRYTSILLHVLVISNLGHLKNKMIIRHLDINGV